MQHTYYRTSVSESDLIGDVCWDLLVIFMFTTQVLEDVFFCHFFLSNLLESMILWRVLQDTLGTCYTVLVHKRIWWSTVICQHSLKNVRNLKKETIISWFMNCLWVIFLSAWEVTNNCTSMQLAEQQTSTHKMQTKVATNGMYQFCLLLKCNNGKALHIFYSSFL